MVGGLGGNPSGRAHLGGVESLRAYAAFAIVIFHVIHLTQASVPKSLEFMKFFFGYGVPLFFVVSAFSLAYGYEGRLFGAGQLKEFYLRRVMHRATLLSRHRHLAGGHGLDRGAAAGHADAGALPELLVQSRPFDR